MKTNPVICIISFLLLTTPGLIAQKPLVFRDTTLAGPQTFAIVVGVSNYKYVRPLNFADKDAELFRDYLKSPAGGQLSDDHIFLLTNEEATNAAFWTKGFQWLNAKQLRNGDRLFIYLAGHGDAIDEDQFFFLAHDCNPAGDKNNYLVGGAIQLFNLKKKIAVETSKGVDVFFIMDACRTSELPGGSQGLNFLNTAITEKKAGEMIMLATEAGKESLEDPAAGNGHGIFTWYLIEGLKGLADTLGTDNTVNFSEIKKYVSRQVPEAARMRFNKNQEPYFCCDEFDEKVIGEIDSAFLIQWLKMKRSRGPGNSFTGIVPPPVQTEAIDSTLLEMYSRFYQAIQSKNFSGANSAEDLYNRLGQQYPGNPYTLDAQSTLATEFIKNAQGKINEMLNCSNELSDAEKNNLFSLGINLEKAIQLVRGQQPEFAESLMSRMYFLKAAGSGTDASGYAHAALATDRNAAFAYNLLALIHLNNNRADSAEFYARQATRLAPNWSCAYLTLSRVFEKMNQPDSAKKYKKVSGSSNPSVALFNFSLPNKIKPSKKIQLGIVLTGGTSQLGFSQSPRDTASNRPSSIFSQSNFRYEFGLSAQINLSNTVSVSPSGLISHDNSDMTYVIFNPQIGEDEIFLIPVKATFASFRLPVAISFSPGNIQPYFSGGPMVNFLINQADNGNRIPLKKSNVAADAAVGVNVPVLKNKLILSPEIRYQNSFSDLNENAGTRFTNAITGLKRKSFSFSIHIRFN